MRNQRSPRVLLLTLVLGSALGVAREVRADALITAGDQAATVRSGRALVLRDGRRAAVIDEVEIESRAQAGLWLRALPSEPRVLRGGSAELLDRLDGLTRVEEPHNEALRRSMFGPSVLTVLTRRWLAPPAPRPSAATATARRLELGTAVTFRGAVRTSSITRRPELPLGLVELVERYGGAKIELELELELAAYLNRGWTVAAIPFADPRPSDPAPARLGPLYAEVESAQALYPIGLMRLQREVRFALYTVAARPLVPVAVEATWDRRPWAPDDDEPRRLRVTYNRPLAADPSLEFALRAEPGLEVPPGLGLLRADLAFAPGVRPDLELVPAGEPVSLPASGGRESPADLLACALLGLTPLLYTPESWLLLWLGARAKARARRGKRPAVLALWPLYAVGVACFWFYTLEGAGRIAAIVPALVGLVQLALPYVDRAPAPVRVQFRKKKAAAKTS